MNLKEIFVKFVFILKKAVMFSFVVNLLAYYLVILTFVIFIMIYIYIYICKIITIFLIYSDFFLRLWHSIRSILTIFSLSLIKFSISYIFYINLSSMLFEIF
jgi:hypothetical protein